ALSTGAAMLGATLTGALAVDTNTTTQDLTLGSYPSQFIKNGVFSGVIVVGENSMASDVIGQAIILNDLATKAVSYTGRKSISGGDKSEEFELGGNLSKEFSSITDSDNVPLIDSEINFDGDTYNVQEQLLINDNVKVETSLTSGDDEYGDKTYLEVTKRGAISVQYVFDESIDLERVNVDGVEPLEITFLGKKLKINHIEDSDTLTATIGTEYFMNVDDSVEVEDKKVTLLNVGSSEDVVVEVAGISQTVNKGTIRTINGVEVKIDSTFYSSNNKAERSATLILGKDAQASYDNGDAYVGESKDNPDWIWKLEGLTGNSPTIAIENDFIYNDDADNPPTVGDCIDLPDNYLKICVNDLNVDTYSDYIWEYDDSADLRDVDNSMVSERTIYLHSDTDEGFTVNGVKANKVWMRLNETENDLLDVYYEDTNDEVKLSDLHYNITEDNVNTKIRINYANTKEDDLQVYAEKGTNNISLSLVPKKFTDDTITSVWGLSGNEINSFGIIADTEEAGELVWQTTNLGTKDEDHRTKYGIIIRDPNSKEFTLSIPEDQVKIEVSITGQKTESVTTSTNEISKINPIPSSVAVLDSEVTSAIAQNLIIVGGPAVNKLAASVFGLKSEDFTPNEAMIKLVANGEKVALLVAGYEAVDTRNAATAVAGGKLSGKAKSDVIVKSTKLGEYTVE
ncbi:MAG: hypothetical protein AABY07_00215, partial [Nanoarchaeota archaeon]